MNSDEFETKLLIDDFLAEIKENFYFCRITYLKHLLYTGIKRLTPKAQKYIISQIYADKFLFDNFVDIVLEFMYLQPSASGCEDKISNQKIIQDDAGTFKVLKLWNSEDNAIKKVKGKEND